MKYICIDFVEEVLDYSDVNMYSDNGKPEATPGRKATGPTGTAGPSKSQQAIEPAEGSFLLSEKRSFLFWK